MLVQEVEEDHFALGYFGFAYYAAEGPALKALAVDAGDGTYRPLSRPLYVYVSEASLARPEGQEFMRFYAAISPRAVADVGYVPLAAEAYAANQRAFEVGRAATPAP